MLDRYNIDVDSLVSLDGLVKIIQILFYLAGGTVAVLTFRSARRGLLNSVNTEYQKRVMDRLRELADELSAEFDSHSPTYWVRQRTVEIVVGDINKVFAANRKQILARGAFSTGLRQTEEMIRIMELLRRIKIDPFIPRQIRDVVAELLDKRIRTISAIHLDEFTQYCASLARGRHISADELEGNYAWVSNRINDRLYKEGVGISQIEDAVSKVQLAIQEYLESFDPLRGRGHLRESK